MIWRLSWPLFLLLATSCLGPMNEIDVSTYPADMQNRYRIFAHRCSRCHELARPLQAHVGARGWDDYVRRMARHPGAGISLREQREIAAFLEFHAQQVERQ